MMRAYRDFIYDVSGDAACMVIAHKGASAYFPENTMASFREALPLGADMIELDVQLTRDMVPVVMHDARVNRCTDGRGWVRNFSFAELRALDAGSWFRKRFAGERVPALEEVLEFCRGKIAVNIEIKTEAVADTARGGIEERVLELVSRQGMIAHVVYSSFDPRALRHLKEMDDSAPIAVLYAKKHYKRMAPAEIVTLMGADCFNCSRGELSATWAREMRDCNIPVYIYTVNRVADFSRLIRDGVGGIFTDKPDVMRAVLSGAGKNAKNT